MMRYKFVAQATSHMHHHAIFTMNDGSKIEGYMQPFDDLYVYTTDLDGKAGAKIKIEDIKDVEFPEG